MEENIKLFDQFKTEWEKHYSNVNGKTEKKQLNTEQRKIFLTWFENCYLESSAGMEKHKNAFWNNKNNFLRFRTLYKNHKRIYGVVKLFLAILVFLIGKLGLDISIEFFGKYQWGWKALGLVIACLIIVVAATALLSLLLPDYAELKNQTNRHCETWLRHQSIVAAYDREMLLYILGQGIYSRDSKEEPEFYFVNNIISLIEINEMEFLRNMQYESKLFCEDSFLLYDNYAKRIDKKLSKKM